ncbi:MAG TPA: DJ-1/PfpI family protein [Puia sp.]|nr:DJ-1/PfpI family protein [Puia sp.]
MRIAYIIFNGITWLDFIGVYDPLTRLRSLKYIPDLSWDVCAVTKSAKDNFGLEIKPTKVQEPLSGYDAIIIPGGFGTRQLQYNMDFVNWIKTAAPVKYKISICTGSLILGAAGFLKDKKATTNFQEYDALRPYCKEVVSDRVVEDGDTITCGAVSASIDLGLFLAKKWAGEEAVKMIRQKMNYLG